MDKIRELIQKKAEQGLVVLDGATGTELQARGMPGGVCPELWCLKNPDVASAVHQDYRDSGADVVYTATFGANRCKLSQYDTNPDVRGINRDLARLARQAIGGGCLVAGDIGPTGRFVEPFGDLDFEEAVGVFREQIQGLLEGGVDLLVIETMVDIQEARAALIAVRELTDLYTLVTMTFEDSGRTLSGTDPVSALVTLQALGTDAVGCNCSAGPEGMIPLIEAMAPYARVPLAAKPNAGLPVLKGGRTVFPMAPREFSGFAARFAAAGVRFLGGCCGTTPGHIRELSAEARRIPAASRPSSRLAALSSARGAVSLERQGPILIIGERINPTGKKDLQEELLAGRMTLVKSYAREQVARGASILDVNVGMPGIDETRTLAEAVSALAVASEAPVCIDSSVPEAMEKALRIYPGRALINSISGEEHKLERLLNAAARYGAMFILLPLAGRALPRSSRERRQIVLDVFERAQALGFTKDDIVVDALTMAVSADAQAAVETLETIRWCSLEFGVRTVLGLSNVSFGLPERRWINAAFLAMAGSCGLTMAIANPMSEELMHLKRASDVLMARDPQARAYIAGFGGAAPKNAGEGAEQRPSNRSPVELVGNAVLEGSRDEITGIIDAALSSGASPQLLVEKAMVPAIQQVGRFYEDRVYFLPQLIASAEAMKKGFEHLEPLLEAGDACLKKQGTIVLATVKDDIHDIGKNIVALMLKNHGFEVIDLGKDVSDEEIVEAALRHKPNIVGLSALMTTTMAHMEGVIRKAREAGVTCPFLVGGAVVTRAFARAIGAHYAADGVEAVKVAGSLLPSE
ncbi:MAG: homocysteine S-methyltransferase family protein [Desulfomonilia bacterium]|jgi:5-methyltetrahydrofolate--homocysteine methyltransferase